MRTPALADAFRKLLETSSSIKVFCVKNSCSRLPPKDHWPGIDENAFLKRVSLGLEKNTSIKTFRMDGYLSKESTDDMLDIISRNSFIQRAFLDVSEENDKQRLELLLADNRKCWTKRVQESNNPIEHRVGVLVEAIEFLPYVDPALVTYHLLRSCPDLIM